MTSFLTALITLLVIIDPFGTSAVYASLTGGMDSAQARRIAIKSILVSLGLFSFFGLCGLFLLTSIGITLDAFRVAGGLLLFVTGFRMLFGFHDHSQIAEQGSPYQDRSSIAVFPLAIPLISGPGCLTAFMLLLSASQSALQTGLTWAAMICALILTLGTLLAARRVIALLGRDVMQVVIRVMGLILSAMAVQFVADGLKNLFG